MKIIHILLLLFLLVPVTEIYLLIEVGGIIGAIPTVFLVVFTAVLGALLIRFQGFSTIARAKASLDHGEVPAIELFEGIILLISGALLLTPGFFTDSIGFLGLIPALRRWLIITVIINKVTRPPYTSQDQHQSQPEDINKPRTIEGKAWHVDDDDAH